MITAKISARTATSWQRYTSYVQVGKRIEATISTTTSMSSIRFWLVPASAGWSAPASSASRRAWHQYSRSRRPIPSSHPRSGICKRLCHDHGHQLKVERTMPAINKGDVQIIVSDTLVQLRARLDCLTKPCDIIHMIVFSPKYQSDGFISCLHCLSDVFVIMGN